MATYTVPAGTSTYANTLTANTADTVTFADHSVYVALTNTGTTVLYATANGATAVVAALGALPVLPGATTLLANGAMWHPSSRVIPAGAAKIPTGGPNNVATSTTQGTNPAQPGTTVPYMSSALGQAANPGTVVSLISTAADSY